jgi:hypothetical protein
VARRTVNPKLVARSSRRRRSPARPPYPASVGGQFSSTTSISGVAAGAARAGGAFQADTVLSGQARVPEPVVVGGSWTVTTTLSAGAPTGDDQSDGGTTIIIFPPHKKAEEEPAAAKSDSVSVNIVVPVFAATSVFSGKAKAIQNPSPEMMALALMLLRVA